MHQHSGLHNGGENEPVQNFPSWSSARGKDGRKHSRLMCYWCRIDAVGTHRLANDGSLEILFDCFPEFRHDVVSRVGVICNSYLFLCCNVGWKKENKLNSVSVPGVKPWTTPVISFITSVT